MDTEPDHTEEPFNEEEFLLARLQRELEGYRSRLQEIEHFHPLDRTGSAHATIDRLLITLTVYFQNNPKTIPHSKLLEEINTLFLKRTY